MALSTQAFTASMGGAGGLFQVGGQLMQGFGQREFARVGAAGARLEARGEELRAEREAELIMRETRRQRSAARAATAASGVRYDEFALAPEMEIEQRGQTDAAMTILSGKRRAESLRSYAGMREASGRQALFSSLFDMAGTAYSGWKGAKGKPAASYHSQAWWKGGAGYEGE